MMLRYWSTLGGVALAPSLAGASSLTFTQLTPYALIGEPTQFIISEQFNSQPFVGAQLHWTWCYADYVSGSQIQLGGWRLNGPLDHEERPGSYDYAELWKQQTLNGLPGSGTVTSELTLILKMTNLTQFTVYTSDGLVESFWVQPYLEAPSVPTVPEPAPGLLVGLGLMVLRMVETKKTRV